MTHLLNKHSQYNQSPLEIATFDGYNSPYHPSVLYFEATWNGYSFWMANSPYPHKTTPYRDRFECPSVFVSNDGYHWDSVNGMSNPIDDLTAEEIKDYDYLSDPHLFVKDGALECWYRKTKRHGKHNYSNSNTHYLLRKTTKDGINWTEKEILMDISKSFGRELVSPAILYQGIYKMWVVDLKPGDGQYAIGHLTSGDGSNWSDMQLCQLEGKTIQPWHIDVQFFDGFYWLTCYEKFKDLTLWKSANGTSFEYVCQLLSPSHTTASFYGKMLYRASLAKVSDNDYRLYFSAEDDFSSHIGVMQGESPTSMHVVYVDGKDYRSIHNLKDLFVLYVRGISASILFKIKVRLSQL